MLQEILEPKDETEKSLQSPPRGVFDRECRHVKPGCLAMVDLGTGRKSWGEMSEHHRLPTSLCTARKNKVRLPITPTRNLYFSRMQSESPFGLIETHDYLVDTAMRRENEIEEHLVRAVSRRSDHGARRCSGSDQSFFHRIETNFYRRADRAILRE